MNGEKVRELRMAARLSQEKLAERCGTSTAMINYIENGRRVPSVALLKAIADELDTTMDELVS